MADFSHAEAAHTSHVPFGFWPLNRRDLLRVGSIALAGTLLPNSPVKANQVQSASARSVIVLWMAGGVTHIDSFDPKPDAPEDMRGTLSTIPTTLPGVRFSEVLPCLARATDKIAVLRSFAHDSNDHFVSQAYALSGRRVAPNQVVTEPNVGAVVAKLHGTREGLPGYIAVPGTTRPGPPPTNLFTGGWLGRQYSPFCTGGNPRNEDFTARVREPDEEDFHRQCLETHGEMSAPRLTGRQSLRGRLDEHLRRWVANPHADALAEQYHGAFAMLTSPRVRQAFELRQEPRATRERYGLTKIGQRCLLARRLVEAG
ncbi:MAG: DUF1501 domain-containing protein, partial [Planctomycetes bacterium]|nr:DUF1501 domain-containing protein [Planctomycetota bacterium]